MISAVDYNNEVDWRWLGAVCWAS